MHAAPEVAGFSSVDKYNLQRFVDAQAHGFLGFRV